MILQLVASVIQLLFSIALLVTVVVFFRRLRTYREQYYRDRLEALQREVDRAIEATNQVDEKTKVVLTGPREVPPVGRDGYDRRFEGGPMPFDPWPSKPPSIE